MKKNYHKYKIYFKSFKKLIDKFDISLITKVEKELEKFKNSNKKVFIFGNGGSASISSHVSTDLIRICKIKAVTLNESNFITCFANDYGYENWVKEALKAHSEKNDLVILISSSGESKNMINAAKYCRGRLRLITLTGFKKNNRLSKIGNINLWIDSKKYNYVENMHQLILLSVVDNLKK
ncbi:MAG: phosphoheptose isomerase [Crocinitomicaceae bacterium]|nr:phosphoheptose isomerase [Crocinitomicaceae bacterium]|tara:strand:- start:552 stop:1091 length:540 start_codon:yes stop_codon:yes gene_type:complete